MSGKEALSAVVRTDLKQLENVLEVYHKQFFKDSYRTDFEWVDQIRPVSDSALEAELTDALVRLIRTRTVSDRCWLALPDILEWSRVNGFYYSQRPRILKHHDLDLHSFLSETFNDLKDLSEERL
jgi:uncharacterized protein (TIGR04141 family)